MRRLSLNAASTKKENVERRLSLNAASTKKENVERNEHKNEQTNILLLLLGDDGKRHEVMLIQLQLENKLIIDLIREVQQKATIRSLRNQGYHCICDADATVMNSQNLIQNHFFGDIGEHLYHLAIPVPYGRTCREIVNMAQPFLNDEKISIMITKVKASRQIVFTSHGVDDDYASQLSEISDDGDIKSFDDSSSSSSSSSFTSGI